jgi:NifU-like protein involved in Fe-S cluster formation
VLAQASASILGNSLLGLTQADLQNLRAQILEMLRGGTPPAEPFDRYATLAAAAEFPSRHRCVLLPLDAALKAFEASQTSDPGGQRA